MNGCIGPSANTSFTIPVAIPESPGNSVSRPYGRRSSDPVMTSARILWLDRNSFLLERKTFSGFRSVNLKKKDISGVLAWDRDRV